MIALHNNGYYCSVHPPPTTKERIWGIHLKQDVMITIHMKWQRQKKNNWVDSVSWIICCMGEERKNGIEHVDIGCERVNDIFNSLSACCRWGGGGTLFLVMLVDSPCPL